jgi:hypothetical protein
MDEWSPHTVIHRLKCLEGQDIDISEEYISRVDPPLYHAVLCCFSEWREALAAAGFDYAGNLRSRTS